MTKTLSYKLIVKHFGESANKIATFFHSELSVLIGVTDIVHKKRIFLLLFFSLIYLKEAKNSDILRSIMTVTDICLFSVWAIAILYGAARGFLYSIIWPCAFILATMAAFSYYWITKGLLISILISLLGPFVLAWAFKVILKLRSKNNASFDPGPLSRLAGAAVTFAWTAVLVLPVVFILAIVPSFYPFSDIHKDVHASWSFYLIKPFLHAEPSADTQFIQKVMTSYMQFNQTK